MDPIYSERKLQIVDILHIENPEVDIKKVKGVYIVDIPHIKNPEVDIKKVKGVYIKYIIYDTYTYIIYAEHKSAYEEVKGGVEILYFFQGIFNHAVDP